MKEKGRWIVMVHVGAGHHTPENDVDYEKACQMACLASKSILDQQGTALDAVIAATRVLEDDPIANAGFGSVLTEEGTIECDAAIMDGRDGKFGAIGAVSGIKNPIVVAAKLLEEDRLGHAGLSQIPPM
jgi:taspase (threonine aspartase 1)